MIFSRRKLTRPPPPEPEHRTFARSDNLMSFPLSQRPAPAQSSFDYKSRWPLWHCGATEKFRVTRIQAAIRQDPRRRPVVLKHSANIVRQDSGTWRRPSALTPQPRPRRVSNSWRHQYPTSDWLRSICARLISPSTRVRRAPAIHRQTYSVLAGNMARATNASVAPGAEECRQSSVCSSPRRLSAPALDQAPCRQTQRTQVKPFGAITGGS